MDQLLDSDTKATPVLDAVPLMSLPARRQVVAERRHPAVLTPHIGELAVMLAALLVCDADRIAANRPASVREASDAYGAIVALKRATSLVAAPDRPTFAYAGGGVGLATGGQAML